MIDMVLVEAAKSDAFDQSGGHGVPALAVGGFGLAYSVARFLDGAGMRIPASQFLPYTDLSSELRERCIISAPQLRDVPLVGDQFGNHTASDATWVLPEGSFRRTVPYLR